MADRYAEACAYFRVSTSKARHQVRCPCHNDGTASLSIARGKKQDLIVRCHAGCSSADILQVITLTAPAATTTTEVKQESAAQHPRIVASYEYRDAQGNAVAVKRRMEPKSFTWMAYDSAEHRMRAGLPEGGQTNVPLYNLPDVLAQVAAQQIVFVVEGEKDADNLRFHGYVATCNPEGASGAGSAYTEERWEPLRGALVVVLPDNDEPGEKHAQRVADTLLSVAKAVKVVKLPGLEVKGDVSDFFENNKKEDFARVVDSTPAYGLPTASVLTAASEMAAGLGVTERVTPISMKDWETEAQAMTAPISAVPTPFATMNDACRRGAARKGWRLGWHIVLAGAPGFGKTTVALNCAVHAALVGKKVGIVSLEQGKDEIMAIMLSIATQTHERELGAIPGTLNLTWLEKAALFQSMLDQSGGGVYLVDMPRSDLHTVEKVTDQMVSEGCELQVTDYMQRITVKGKDDDYARLTDISNTLQGKAKARRYVSLALSQFNRGTSGASYAPKAQGLKGSSAIEDDANQIWLIDHTRYHRHNDEQGADFVLKADKNRHGPTVSIPLAIDYGTARVTERRVA